MFMDVATFFGACVFVFFLIRLFSLLAFFEFGFCRSRSVAFGWCAGGVDGVDVVGVVIRLSAWFNSNCFLSKFLAAKRKNARFDCDVKALSRSYFTGWFNGGWERPFRAANNQVKWTDGITLKRAKQVTLTRHVRVEFFSISRVFLDFTPEKSDLMTRRFRDTKHVTH